MHTASTCIQLLVVVGLLLLLEVGGCGRVNASALIVYDYGFAKQVTWVGSNGRFVPVNRTSSFTQDDPTVYAFVTASLYNASLTWNWYDPDGRLYKNETNQVQCQVTPCTYLSWLLVAGTPAAIRFGVWTLDLLDQGLVYSDHFMITPVITEDDYWNFDVNQSAPPHVHGDLTVTIHPNNQTWSSYKLIMPYAANVTAFEPLSNRTLEVMTFNDSSVVVNFGAGRSDGYRFELSFDLIYGAHDLNTWRGGSFVFTWEDQPWERGWPDAHPIPETFSITLPQGALLVDTVGINAMALNNKVTNGGRPCIFFTTTVPPQQRFGWAIIYRDFTWRNSHHNVLLTSATAVGIPYAANQPIPVLPVTLGSVSLWSAVMSVFMLTGSELLSPIYARTGVLIDRRRLRIAALFLVAVFVAATAYQLIIAQYTAPIPAR